MNEWEDGSRWHENAMVCPAGGSANDIRSGHHTYELTWKPGTRHAIAADFHLSFPDGRQLDVHLDAALTFFMQGVGYTHPTWRHGCYIGPDERTSDSLMLSEVNEADLLAQHVQILSKASTNDGQTGWGILEMLIFGPHTTSGFTQPFDMHP